jgi:AraC-like DNA-binding protein
LDFFLEIGAPVDERLEDSKLPAELAETPERPCPSRALYGVIDRLADDAGVSDVGLKVGARTRIRSLGGFGHEVANAATLGNAIRTAQRLMPAVHTGRSLTLSCDGPRARLSSRLDEAQLSPSPWDDHFVLLLMIDLVRMAAGPGWRPEAVAIQTPGVEGLRDCAPLANARIRCGADTTMVTFPRALLHQRLASGRAAASVSESSAHGRFDATPLPTELTGSLQAVVECLLAEDSSDLATTAAIIGTSRRTLQRQLRASGDTFSHVLARARLARARGLLDETPFRVIDIAFELGYSDHAHFTKAFRRWTGLTPRAYRSGAEVPVAVLQSGFASGAAHVTARPA